MRGWARAEPMTPAERRAQAATPETTPKRMRKDSLTCPKRCASQHISQTVSGANSCVWIVNAHYPPASRTLIAVIAVHTRIADEADFTSTRRRLPAGKFGA